MGFLDVLKTIGSTAVSLFVPGGPAIVAAVNAVLPEDRKLPATATGQDIQNASDSLPPEVQVELGQQDVDLELGLDRGWTERVKAMSKADGQSTRPKIAHEMSQVLAFEICAFTVWCFLYPEQMSNPVLWTVFGVLTGVPAAILNKYFGELRKEAANRIAGANGVSPVAGVLSQVAKLWKGK